MKLTIERAALLRALGHVQSVVERRNTIPILSNVLLAPRTANWRSPPPTWISKWSRPCRPQGVKAGGTTVPAHTLYDIVRKLPEGAQVELEPAATRARSACAPAARPSPSPACRPRIIR